MAMPMLRPTCPHTAVTLVQEILMLVVLLSVAMLEHWPMSLQAMLYQQMVSFGAMVHLIQRVVVVAVA